MQTNRSIAEHGSTLILEVEIKPLLEKYGAALYINGHDHNLQHLNDGSTVEYLDCGAGQFEDPSTTHRYKGLLFLFLSLKASHTHTHTKTVYACVSSSCAALRSQRAPQSSSCPEVAFVAPKSTMRLTQW